jgi:large subunit ribosomal protein L15
LVFRNAKTYAPVNLDRIQHWVDQGRLTSSPKDPITARDLLESGCIHNAHDGVKVLGDVCITDGFCTSYLMCLLQGSEHLKAPLYIIASRASQSAIKAIEDKGGKIVCKYYTLALRDCLEGRIDRISAAPTRREDISKLPNIFP